MTQDVFLSAYKAISGFREDSQFSTWIHRIAVNKTLNRLQKKKLPVRSINDSKPGEDDARPLEIPDPSQGPQACLEGSELREQMSRALDRLSDNLRQVFILRELQHRSHEEIAEMLGSNPQAVRVRLHRAKKELVALLSPYVEAAG